MTSKSAPPFALRPAVSLLSGLVNFAWYLGAVLLVVAMVMTAVHPFIEIPDGELGIPVSFSTTADHPVRSEPLGIEGAHIRDVRGTLVFPPKPGESFVALGLLLIAMLALAMWVIGELRALLRTVRAGQPFAPANAARLRRVAWIVLLGEPLRAFVVWSNHAFVRDNFSSPGLRFEASVDFSFSAIFSGLVILVLAEIFRAGTKLDEDQSLTV